MQTLKGISFPFRIGVKGGVVTTKADLTQATHLAESIQQICLTQVGERVMENLGSQISAQIFDLNEESTYTLIKYEIKDAINNFEPRVEVNMDDIEVYASSSDNEIRVTVNFKVIETGVQDTINFSLE
jgi:phage baseplate assembly protein W